MVQILRRFSAVCVMLTAFFLTGCGSEDALAAPVGDSVRETHYSFPMPEASGVSMLELDKVRIDASNTDKGYIMLAYEGEAEKVRLQITSPSGNIYSYPILKGGYRTFPLTEGSGSYAVTVLEHAFDNMFSVAASTNIIVEISDDFAPFLYPNQYVWYDEGSEAVALGIELSEKSSSDLDYLTRLYKFVTKNIKYDKAAAESATAEYIPDIDRCLEDKKGICFDYASLMAALLRSQGIPTKLVTGYSGTAYHAWISVYLSESGWVDGIISFDGKNWSLMDPTLAASNSSSSVKKYIGDGSNYLEEFYY